MITETASGIWKTNIPSSSKRLYFDTNASLSAVVGLPCSVPLHSVITCNQSRACAPVAKATT
jgi:hypothetical protein